MADVRTRGVAIGAVAAACVACCSIPFLAGATILGVAVCSTRFLGVAFGIAVLAGGVGWLWLRARRRRSAPVPVGLGPTRHRGAGSL
jgi:hypothetical protein